MPKFPLSQAPSGSSLRVLLSALGPGNAIGPWLLPVLLLLWMLVSRRGPDLFDWVSWLGAAVPLVIAAIAQAQVVLVGGQGLGAGSVALFVNALIAVNMAGTPGSMAAWVFAGPAIGGLIGALNGAVIGYLRISSTAVTLATGFITAGATLVMLDNPAPILPDAFRAALDGSVLPGIPAAFAVVALLLALALCIDLAPIGAAIRVAGRGPRLDRKPATVLLAYAIAGAGYGLSGVFLSAQLGTADPLLGSPALLDIYAAVALGGSLPHLRQGSTFGAALGALAISAVVNLLVPLGVDDSFVPAIDGILLLLAIAIASRNPLPTAARSLAPPPRRHRLLDRGLLAWLGIGAIVPLLLLRGAGMPSNDLWIDMIILGTLTLGQALVVLTGALDLSLPAITGLAGLATVSLIQGSAPATLWVVPLVLTCGGAIGAVSGKVGITFGNARILVTLAIAGLLQSGAVSLTFGRPTGFASKPLVAFMADRPSGTAIVVLVLGPMLIAAILWLAVSSRRRGLVSAVPAHACAGLLAAGVGIMLAGYGGEFRIGIVDTLALPSLLAIAAAGIAIGEGGGGPIGLIAAVPMAIAFDTLLVGWGTTYPQRMIAMGLALLAAILLLGMAPGIRARAQPRS
jgi:ribose transport system permease protein